MPVINYRFCNTYLAAAETLDDEVKAELTIMPMPFISLQLGMVSQSSFVNRDGNLDPFRNTVKASDGQQEAWSFLREISNDLAFL